MNSFNLDSIISTFYNPDKTKTLEKKLFINDIDFTKDFEGVKLKEEIIGVLPNTFDFRKQFS